MNVIKGAILALIALLIIIWIKTSIKTDGIRTEFCGWSTGGSCNTDADCITDGCSGQVCRSVTESPVITTCEWRECYDALKYGVRCRCIDGVCKWS